MNKIRILLAIFFLLLFLTIGWYLFFRSRSEKLIASGTIEAKEVVVSSKIVGKVTEVMVDEGQETKVGQVLALIDSREAQIAVENAKANFSVAEADLKRHSQLFSQGVITKQQFDRAKANYEVALASLENAKIYLENTVVVSPLSGIVLVRAIEPGELATIGVPIVTIANLNELELVVYLPERDVGRVKIGEEVLVSVDAYPNEKFKGKVSSISERAEFTPKVIQTREERTTQVFGVKIKIANPELKLKPGMPADAEFLWNTQ